MKLDRHVPLTRMLTIHIDGSWQSFRNCISKAGGKLTIEGPRNDMIAAGFIVPDQELPGGHTAVKEVHVDDEPCKLGRLADGRVRLSWCPTAAVVRRNEDFQSMLHRAIDPNAKLPDFSLPTAPAHSEPRRFTEEEAVEEFVRMHGQSSNKVRRLGVGSILGRTVSNDEAFAWHQSACDADRYRMIRIGIELYFASKGDGDAAPTLPASLPRPRKRNAGSVRNLIAVARRRDDDGASRVC